jgi:hypothetical protein
MPDTIDNSYTTSMFADQKTFHPDGYQQLHDKYASPVSKRKYRHDEIQSLINDLNDCCEELNSNATGHHQDYADSVHGMEAAMQKLTEQISAMKNLLATMTAKIQTPSSSTARKQTK